MLRMHEDSFILTNGLTVPDGCCEWNATPPPYLRHLNLQHVLTRLLCDDLTTMAQFLLPRNDCGQPCLKRLHLRTIVEPPN